MEKQSSKLEEKIIHKSCEKHGKMICTVCNPVKEATSKEDKFYNEYHSYWLEYGRELVLNHKEMEPSNEEGRQ
jgi:hypothetical protein